MVVNGRGCLTWVPRGFPRRWKWLCSQSLACIRNLRLRVACSTERSSTRRVSEGTSDTTICNERTMRRMFEWFFTDWHRQRLFWIDRRSPRGTKRSVSSIDRHSLHCPSNNTQRNSIEAFAENSTDLRESARRIRRRTIRRNGVSQSHGVCNYRLNPEFQ